MPRKEHGRIEIKGGWKGERIFYCYHRRRRRHDVAEPDLLLPPVASRIIRLDVCMAAARKRTRNEQGRGRASFATRVGGVQKVKTSILLAKGP